MEDIVKINLDNEMDLILAHKRTMKLAELCGLSLPSQTTFATAVSEIARSAIGYGKKSHLILKINFLRAGRKEIVASLLDQVDLSTVYPEAFSYASRLMGSIEAAKTDGWFEFNITHAVPFSGTISPAKIESFKDYFKNEPPLSPYDEIRKKNIQLIDLADKLRESEKQYRLLTDTLPLMIFAVNQKGMLTYANKGLSDFWSKHETKITSLVWPAILHAEDVKSVQAGWDKAMATGTAFHGQARLRQHDKFIWHLISIVPVKNEKDIITNWIGFFADIELQKQISEALRDNRELKKIQEALQQYQDTLEQKVAELNISNRNLEQFAYIASHDLQEPLRKIKTFTGLLHRTLQLSEKEQYYFDKIVGSADRMSTLINDVLNYSTFADSKKENFRLIDLNEALQTVLNDFELLIAEKNAEIKADKLPAVPGLPLQFEQLFSNLLSNSLKFSQQKPVINIRASEMSAAQAGQNPLLQPGNSYCEIIFEDNGIGFEQQYAEKIFDIFQRLTNDRSGGTGIGLALVKKIVENHKGFVTATSEPGKGASFKIILPATMAATV